MIIVFFLYLVGFEDVEHEGESEADQLLAVVLLFDGGEVSEERECHGWPGLLLGTTQGLQPHVQLPGHTCSTERYNRHDTY